MNHEQQNNASRRQAAEARRRKLQRQRSFLIAVAVVAVCLLIGFVQVLRSIADGENPSTKPSTTAPSTSLVPNPTEPKEPQTVITLTFGGDLNVTDKVIASGETGGKYDFTNQFSDVASIFAQADASVLNFEGNLVGAPYGSASGSAPEALMQAMRAAGLDFVQMANSCSVNNGLGGLGQTLNGIRQNGMEPLGAFASTQEYKQTEGFTLRNIGGLRVAFVAFTKGFNNMGLPAGSEDCVNLLYTDYSSNYQKVDTEGINAVLEAVRAQQPDVTIALLHWGSEFNSSISKSQDKIRQLLIDGGVDAIIGTHPHLVQKVEQDEESGALVAYSLGDLFGDAEKEGTQYSVVLQLQFTRDNYTGETKLTAWDYVPVYTLTPERDGEAMRVVRIREAISMYENNHVSKVSREAYENMKAALKRIEARMGK